MTLNKHEPSPSILPPEPPPDSWLPHIAGEPAPALESDDVVKTMRKYCFTGPITREAYIGFICTKDQRAEWSVEQEADLPEELQDFSQFERG